MLSAVVEKWKESCRIKGLPFARIQTERAIYYRVAVVEETPVHYKIVYSNGSDRDGYHLKQARIMKRDVVRIRWYKD